MITVVTTETNICVAIPKAEVSAGQLNLLLEWLRLESLASQSRLNQGDAEPLAEEIKASWWAANKARFINPA
jgi:hypothetical protein